MLVLAQFALRLSFGLAAAMACTSPTQVTSGFFRNHSYVLLGLNVLSVLASMAGGSSTVMWLSIAAAVCSYMSSAAWLYEQHRLGAALLWLTAAAALAAAWASQLLPTDATTFATVLWRLDPIAGGLLLGFTIAAMFLGHWYLNTPTMELAPLLKLLRLVGVAVALRAIVCSGGLVLQLQTAGLSTSLGLLLLLRWAAGIVGVAVLAWMARETLKIPNTQSATGILYVAVIVSFIGELTGLLLSAEIGNPV